MNKKVGRPVIYKKPRTRIDVKVSATLSKKLNALKKQKNITLTSLVEEALTAYVKKPALASTMAPTV